jgi:hypothetical protein
MNDPVKVIFKFKNNNRRLQHHVYVFIGNVSTKISSILNSIKELNLYNSFIKLDKSDYNKLAQKYGDYWYKKFFNIYHINNTIDLIRKSKSLQKDLINKYGKIWYDLHIEKHKMMDRKLFYNYSTSVKNEMIKKELRIKKVNSEEPDIDQDIDYSTRRKNIVKDYEYQLSNVKNVESTSELQNMEISSEPMNLESTSELQNMEISSEPMNLESTSELQNMEGGNNKDVDDIIHMIQDNILDTSDQYGGQEVIRDINSINISDQYGGQEVIRDINSINISDAEEHADTDNDGVVEFEEGLDTDVSLIEEEEDLNFEEMEKLYQDMDVNVDLDTNKTTKLIKEAIKDDKLFKKKNYQLIEFDTSKDDLMYDELLKDVYITHYIETQYIFKDDTVKMIKNKIACSILNNSKFETKSHLAPSRQYLWSNYIFDDKEEKVMIGQKWIRKTDLLKIDVEPETNIRYYEELRGNLKLLKENIKRYGSKIKREDDDFNIYHDYEDYIMNDEIYMIDIYNELGSKYKPSDENLRNIYDVFVRVYFPRIKQEDIKHVIDYLNGNTTIESEKSTAIFESINNDLIIENQIMSTVEDVKTTTIYKDLFKDNYITQSVIHVNLREKNKKKLDLFRIFDQFIVNDSYPFIQYQTTDGQIIFKFNETNIIEYSSSKNNVDVLSKWFENAPYGISFKVKITEKNVDKFMAINLNETGRIEYKTQWKEEDMATIDDIKNTYNYVKNLILKINKEKNKINFEDPVDNEFKYAFINTIQKFILPDKFNINHNDLSEFSRYFYPYVSLVIEPRKRQSKIKKDDEKSKFGTYLRYKRVSKYENQTRIEQRILYFMRNYDYNDQSLASEISKQFNTTIDRSIEEIERVINKYPNIKKSRKILKKLENIPKYKPPGIGVDIQGKQRDKYKIRISGARNKEQLDRIISFMNILIFLYVETYLYKKSDRQDLKEKLKKLTNIARRRNRVEEIVDHDTTTKTVKQMAQSDKQRIGFKPEKGQHQWTRACQNSGDDKKRRPQQYLTSDDLIKQGFKLDTKNAIYLKEINGKGKKKITLRAVSLKNIDDTGNESGVVYYSCNPEDNGEHMFVGFLSRSANPHGQCMPCCFKKDPSISKNKEKKDYFMKCIGKKKETDENQIAKIIGDRLYILQDTNKIQEGRFGFLPKYLDFFFNIALDKEKKIHQHYLLSTKTGYYFKFGSRQDKYPFLNAVASLVDININDIIAKLVDKLEKDKTNILFTALNNGDIKTQFGTSENYIKFIKNNKILEFESINHIISLPNIIKQHGLNIVVFKKETIIIQTDLQKEITRDDFTIICQNPEETKNLENPNMDTIFIIKENKNYYPIVMVTKKDESTKGVSIDKLFKYQKSNENIISHSLDFYNRNCQVNLLNTISKNNLSLTAKDTNAILRDIGKEDMIAKYQIIDSRNKCKYLVTKKNIMIPVKPSGSIYNLSIVKNAELKIDTLSNTIENLKQLYIATNKKLQVEPIGLYYDVKTSNNASIVGIMTKSYDVVPVINEVKDLDWINKQGFVIENKHLYDKIDDEINKGKQNIDIDERVLSVNTNTYQDETYNLFRLEFSNYLNKVDNDALRKKFMKLTNDKKIDKKLKRNNIRKLLYRVVDSNLLKIFEKQDGGSYDKFIHIVNTMPKLDNYVINNNRDTCQIHKTKDICNNSKHCYFTHDKCYLQLTTEMAIKFINIISEELINSSVKALEIYNVDDYFVSDIVEFNKFTERTDQKIIKSTNFAIDKVLNELFGSENIPKIGKRRIIKSQEINFQQLNIEQPLQDLGKFMVQRIIDNNLSIIRAYSNGYFWNKLNYYDLDSRNLGYYSTLQTNLTNYFRSIIIDWLVDKKNTQDINDNLVNYFEIKLTKNIIKEFIMKMTRDVVNTTSGIVEYYILNKLHNIPVIIYNDSDVILYIIDDGVKFDHKKNKIDDLNKKEYAQYIDKNQLQQFINIRFTIFGKSYVPTNIDVVYFKK